MDVNLLPFYHEKVNHLWPQSKNFKQLEKRTSCSVTTPETKDFSSFGVVDFLFKYVQQGKAMPARQNLLQDSFNWNVESLNSIYNLLLSDHFFSRPSPPSPPKSFTDSA